MNVMTDAVPSSPLVPIINHPPAGGGTTMEQPEHGISRRSVLHKGVIASGVLVLGGTAATGTAAADIGDGRVGHYNLNNLHMNKETGEKIKNFVHDASPEKNHGTWEGDETDPVVDGWVGNALTFDGNDWVSLNFGDGSEIVYEDWTISGWINPADWSDTSRKEWLSVSEDRSTGRPLDLVHEDGKIKHYRGLAAGEVMAHDVSGESGWHHMLVTQKRTDSSTVDLTMYFDGVEVDSTSGDYENMRPSLQFYLGRVAGSDPDRFYWDGEIDEVRVYNRVLSDSEIDDLAAMGDE